MKYSFTYKELNFDSTFFVVLKKMIGMFKTTKEVIDIDESILRRSNMLLSVRENKNFFEYKKD